MKHISTTITKKFFEMKMQDLEDTGYFVEFKDEKSFWSNRLNKIAVNGFGKPKEETEIVFLVGSSPHRFRVVDVFSVHHDFIPTRYRDAIKTEYAYAIKCVKAVV